ncbi:MAG: hypothetical protein HWN80_16040 [Candidatus Lokiarchaeota archaeon]|nr:hypothetical protein [Candidatus Lokiarchaeota archaeon]
MENSDKNTKDVSKNKDNELLSDNNSSKSQVPVKSKGHSKGVKTKTGSKKKGKEYLSTEEELDIPLVPESPKQKDKITINSPGLSADLVTQMKKLESSKNKVVLVNCERCKEIIAVPIPRAFVLKSELPVVPVSYVHKNSKKKDQHCITLHLDHDFDIRRQRISDVVFSPK